MADGVFFSGVADKLAFTYRLVRKKYREGETVAIYGPAAQLARLDFQLWATDALDFLPHVRVRPGVAPAAALRARTRIWLLEEPLETLRCRNSVNLGLDEAPWLATHERVAEVLGLEEPERAAGRRRWRQYEAQGCALTHRPQSGG